MRLCLGTVQFGMDYGLCGGRKPSPEEAVGMLDFATQNGVDAIDTARAYGDAEDVVGAFLSRRTVPRERLFVVSKFGEESFDRNGGRRLSLVASAEESLSRLKTDYLDAFVCHVASCAGDAEVIAAMAELKRRGLARHVGFSVYETSEAMKALESEAVDFLQVPYSVFDQRMKRDGVFEISRRRGTDVHVRSVFVQGLALMTEEDVPPYLDRMRPRIRDLQSLCDEFGLTRRALAMAFVRRTAGISHLVFGVDSLGQLKENIGSFSEEIPDEALDRAAELFVDVEPELVMPNKWRKP